MALAFAKLDFTEQCVNPVFSTKIEKAPYKRGVFFILLYFRIFDEIFPEAHR